MNKQSLGKIIVCLAVMAVLAVSSSAQVVTPPTQPSPIENAKALMTKSKFAEALPILEGITSSDKTSAPQALVMTGECYKALKKWSKAIEAFQKLMADYPNAAAPDKEVKLWIMDCLLANKEPDKALAMQKELIPQFGPESWRVYLVLGRRYTWNHDPTRAIVELEKAAALGVAAKDSPDMIDLNRRLLHCYVGTKQAEKAETLAQKLNKDYPKISYEWNYELGRLYLGQQEYEKAIECLESASKTVPKTLPVSKNISKTLLDCYDEIGNLDSATELAEGLIAEEPGKSSWQWRLGTYYMSKQQYAKAEPLFAEVIKTSKADWEIRKGLISRGQCLYNLGRGPDALKMVEDYFRDKPEKWDDHLLIKAGVLYYGPRDYAGCVASLTELMTQVDAGKKSALVSASSELLYKALVRNGDQSQAGVEAEKMWTSTKDSDWLLNAGQAYYKAGKYAEAKRVYKGISDDSGMPDGMRAFGLHGLALCYWQTGLKESARRLAERVKTEYSGTLAATAAINSLNEWSLVK